MVIFNNSTGRVLNDEQQEALAHFVENGGALMGIHGAGDNSHHWPWYENNLLGAHFSHHTLHPHLQQAQVKLERQVDSAFARNLSPQWVNTDEWYVFSSQPTGVKFLYSIDGERLITNGNFLWMIDKNFGMGKHHPVAWYKSVGRGKTFYTSMGNGKEAWDKPEFVNLLEKAISWAMH